MAKKKPRKPYRPPNYKAEAARLNPEKYGQEQFAEDTKHEGVHPTPVDKEPPAPAHPHVLRDAPRRAPQGKSRYLVPVAAGAGVIGGGAYLAHRARRRKTVAKGLVNPLTGGSVVFEKRYLEDDVDEAPRGVLVAKAGTSFKGVGGMKGVEFKVRARDKAVQQGRRAVARGRDAAAGAADAGRRGAAFARRNKKGVAIGGGLAAYTGAAVGVSHHMGRERALAGQPISPWGPYLGGVPYSAGYKSGQKELARKRYDETALEHFGSRRVGGRLPVSTVRVSGLPVQSATFSRGNAEARPGTRSHANRLTHVHTNVKAHRSGRLFVLHRKSRSRSGSEVGKSAGFAQSGGSGRRLVGI